MGMGYAAGFAVVISEEEIKKMNLHWFTKFMDILEMHHVSLDEFASAYQYDDELENLTENDQNIVFYYFENFQGEFTNETGVGINIGYHNAEDDGSCYDEVDGAFFELEFSDIYEFSPAAKKLKDNVYFDIQRFVQFG